MGTRPTTDKVKEAIFSMIGPYFDGGAVLDLFAGTGGLGIEALSRGMEQAIFVDMDNKSIETVRHNLKATKFEEQAEVYRNEAIRALKALEKRGVAFDLVFLDPPYRMKNGDEIMQLIADRQLMRSGGTVVLEHDSKHKYPDTVGHYNCLRRSEYGEAAVTIYRYEPSGQAELEPGDTNEEEQHGTTHE